MLFLGGTDFILSSPEGRGFSGSITAGVGVDQDSGDLTKNRRIRDQTLLF